MAPAKAEKLLAKLKKEEPRLKAHVNELEMKLEDINLKIEQPNDPEEREKLIIERRRIERESLRKICLSLLYSRYKNIVSLEHV